MAGFELSLSLLWIALVRSTADEQTSRLTLELLTATMYSFGFIVVVLGRSELFTEQTTLAIFPLLAGKTSLAKVKFHSSSTSARRDVLGSMISDPYEDAVHDTPIFEENGPDNFKGIDIMRAVRSFDPCLPCGLRMYQDNGNPIGEVRHVPMFGLQQASHGSIPSCRHE